MAKSPVIWLVVLFSAALVSAGRGGAGAVDPQNRVALPVRYKHLLLLYEKTDVSYVENGTPKSFEGTMPGPLQETVIGAFQNLPFLILDGSNGDVESECEVLVIGHAVKRIAKVKSSPDMFWFSPTDIQADLRQYAREGAYDSVHVVWHNGPIPCYFGLGGVLINNGTATFSSIVSGRESWWTGTGEAYGEPLLHEWLHGVTAYLRAKGYANFPVDDLHGAEAYGYKHSPPEGWMAWYRDYMQGKVWDAKKRSYLGITREAWAMGTPSGNKR